MVFGKEVSGFLIAAVALLHQIVAAKDVGLDSAAALAIRGLPPEYASGSGESSNLTASKPFAQPQTPTYPLGANWLTGLAAMVLGSRPVCNSGGCVQQGGR